MITMIVVPSSNYLLPLLREHGEVEGDELQV